MITTFKHYLEFDDASEGVFDDMLDWLSENTTSFAVSSHRSTPDPDDTSDDPEAGGLDYLSVKFTRDRDAVLFRLRWTDDDELRSWESREAFELCDPRKEAELELAISEWGKRHAGRF